MSRKRRLVDKINEEFEKLVGDKQQRQYSQYMRAINNDVVDEMPKSKKQLRKIINRHQLNPNTSIKMFSVMNGVQNLLLNPPTRESRKKLKPLEGLMRVYNVNNPKSFANAMYQMTTGQKQSDRNKRFRPLLLSYYDGFTENIETLEQQAQRAMKRAELEMQSTLFADMEELRRERLPITQVKKRLLEKYNDPKRIRRALDTELHEQAERVKLEQSKFMGYTHKKWNTQSDERVRRTKFHNQVANKVIPVDSQFKGGGIKADYPGDIDLPVGERINCRCYITYHNKPQAIPTSAPIIAPPRRRTSTQATPSVRKRRFVKGNTREEAIDNLRKLNPNIRFNREYAEIANPEFVKDTTNVIGDLMDRFNLTDTPLRLKREIKTKGVGGACSITPYGGDVDRFGKKDINTYIDFNVSNTKKDKTGQALLKKYKETETSIARGWHVPVDQENIKDYTAIHEMGHFVHTQGIGNNPKFIKKMIDISKTLSPDVLDNTKIVKSLIDVEGSYELVLKAREKLDIRIKRGDSPYDMLLQRQTLLSRSNVLYKSIAYALRLKTQEKIIKTHNVDFQEALDITMKETSTYGRTDIYEWFAETFTEYIGSSKPRKHAKAFGEVLEEVFDGTS